MAVIDFDALTQFELEARDGRVEALYNLGLAYSTGQAVDVDYVAARCTPGRLSVRKYLAGRYSVADIATWPWARSFERRGIDIEEFPNVKDWLSRIEKRPGVQRGAKVGENLRAPDYDLGKDLEAQKILFGQRARK